jgi:hypothetical protein
MDALVRPGSAGNERFGGLKPMNRKRIVQLVIGLVASGLLLWFWKSRIDWPIAVLFTMVTLYALGFCVIWKKMRQLERRFESHRHRTPDWECAAIGKSGYRREPIHHVTWGKLDTALDREPIHHVTWGKLDTALDGNAPPQGNQDTEENVRERSK